MFRWQIQTALLGLIIAYRAAAQPVSLPEAKVFFDRYVQLSNSFNIQVADLYADTARVKTLRRYPIARDRQVETSGRHYKSMLVKTMSLAKARNDRNKFKNVEFVRVGQRVRVEADRYALSKCYWDHGYYMLIERQPNKRLKIIEENFETLPQANCKLVSSNFSG